MVYNSNMVKQYDGSSVIMWTDSIIVVFQMIFLKWYN